MVDSVIFDICVEIYLSLFQIQKSVQSMTTSTADIIAKAFQELVMQHIFECTSGFCVELTLYSLDIWYIKQQQRSGNYITVIEYKFSSMYVHFYLSGLFKID